MTVASAKALQPKPVAAGAYLAALRERHQMSQNELARTLMKHYKMKIDGSQIGRLERGVTDSRSVLWARVCRILDGDSDVFLELLATPEMPADEGKKRAKEWLAPDERKRVQKQSQTSNGHLAILIAAYEQATDPQLKDRILRQIGELTGRPRS